MLKRIFLYMPIVLSFFILGAHFLRYGDTLWVFGVAILILLLFVRQPWAARLLQVALVLGTFEWLYTLHWMTELRTSTGDPYMRMVMILGSVAAVTFISALLFQLPTMKRIYRL